jgi:ribosomal protein S18 acetylase RimI-like enzyme
VLIVDGVLDDMAWHALSGPQSALASTAGDGAARCYRDGIAPFCGVERFDARAWDALADLVGSRGVAVFLRADVGLPPAGWTELLREDATQYVAGRLPQPPPTDGEVVELGPGDVPEMVGLAEQTQPGPFGPQSHLTGRHAGVRRDGRLVAMAGERMRVDGWGEISTVCVHPSVRGQGLGAVVTLAAARWIEARGDRPMLHVRAGNDGAHRLYRRIGFEVRRLVTVGVFRRDG